MKVILPLIIACLMCYIVVLYHFKTVDKFSIIQSPVDDFKDNFLHEKLPIVLTGVNAGDIERIMRYQHITSVNVPLTQSLKHRKVRSRYGVLHNTGMERQTVFISSPPCARPLPESEANTPPTTREHAACAAECGAVVILPPMTANILPVHWGFLSERDSVTSKFYHDVLSLVISTVSSPTAWYRKRAL
jgi:hypothetical protein